MTQRLGILSPEIWRLRGDLARLLDSDFVRVVPGFPIRCEAILGWSDGRGEPARRLARRAGLPSRSVAVGPLRSVKPFGEPPMSFRLDVNPGDRGHPGAGAGGSFGIEPRDGLATLRELRLGWRNDGRDRLPDALARGPYVVVVVDGPESGRSRARATDLIQQALATDPDARVALFACSRGPEAIAHDIAAHEPEAVAVGRTNPWALFERARRVYAAPGSDLAILARLAGRDVVPASDPNRAVEEIFRAQFLDGTLYLDAWSRERVSFETAARQLAWLRDRYLENDARSVCVGISRWKAARVAKFLDGPDGPAVFHGSAARAVKAAASVPGRVVAWETRMPGRLAAECARAGVPLVRMEDGFLRSVGLGAAFLPGASAVLDGRGIYYDPTRESDLEHLLATAEFTPELMARARVLREKVVALRLSKYNVGGRRGLDELLGDLPTNREVVLVPGQVEDDASILLGSRVVAGNLALLGAARRRHPDAFLVFKPHPDVAAGLRRGAVELSLALRSADRIVTDVGIAELLERVDDVETMTSLAGFEALLRGKRVAAHGQPFYAGWGLTTDLDPIARRRRRLSLDELVAAALILYPRYLDPVTGLRCPPEVLVNRLAAARDAASGASRSGAAARMAYVRARHAVLTPIGAALRRLRSGPRGGPDRPVPGKPSPPDLPRT